MATETRIEWTDSTFNPWIGCAKISAGCDHCYAEKMNAYRGWTEWGPHGTRRRTSTATWRNPIEWQRDHAKFAARTHRRRRVFCASLADVFDNAAPDEFRSDLWGLIKACPDLDWQLLTKRPQNIAKMLPPDWGNGYPNVWLGITAENQTAFDQRWRKLREIPARIRFISYEPAIGPLRLPEDRISPDWIICGGESGPGARVMNPQWARDIRDQCEALGIAFFHKQWGTYRSNPLVVEKRLSTIEAEQLDPPSNGKGGGLLDGKLYRAFPPG